MGTGASVAHGPLEVDEEPDTEGEEPCGDEAKEDEGEDEEVLSNVGVERLEAKELPPCDISVHGVYQRVKASGEPWVQNKWHRGVIYCDGEMLRWKNQAGKSWSLSPNEDKTMLKTSTDCPYNRKGSEEESKQFIRVESEATRFAFNGDLLQQVKCVELSFLPGNYANGDESLEVEEGHGRFQCQLRVFKESKPLQTLTMLLNWESGDFQIAGSDKIEVKRGEDNKPILVRDGKEFHFHSKPIPLNQTVAGQFFEKREAKPNKQCIDAINTFDACYRMLTSKPIDYAACLAKVNEYFAVHGEPETRESRGWLQDKSVNFGVPVCFYALLMIRDLCGIHVAGLPPLADAGLSAPVKLKFLVLVVNEVHGKWPETEEQMVKNEGVEKVFFADQRLFENDYQVLRECVPIYFEYIHAVTDGRIILEPDLYVIKEPLEYEITNKGFYYCPKGPKRLLAQYVPDEVKRAADFVWLISPCVLPPFKKSNGKDWVPGGMAGNWNGGPMPFCEDLWPLRPGNVGQGSELERKAYMPMWLQHETFHRYFLHIFPEFNLESYGHSWFQRDTWPEDFTGRGEPWYYHEAMFKRFRGEVTGKAHWQRLIFREPPKILGDDLTKLMDEQLAGTYKVVRKRHTGTISPYWTAVLSKGEDGQWLWSSAKDFRLVRNEEGGLFSEKDSPYRYQEIVPVVDAVDTTQIVELRFHNQIWRKQRPE